MVIMCLLLVIMLMVVIAIYHFELKLILFEKFNWHPFDPQELRSDKEHDVYVIYSDKDYIWVQRTLLVGLEQQGYRTVDRRRDFIIGVNDADQVVNFISNSHRVVVVLSQHFMTDREALKDFQQAETQCLAKGNRRFLIMITLQNKIDFGRREIFNQYIATNYFIPANSKRFWARLFYWIPQRSAQTLPTPDAHMPDFSVNTTASANYNRASSNMTTASESTPLLSVTAELND